MFDIDININPVDGGIDTGIETEIRITLDNYLIKQLRNKIQDIDMRYGPDRSVGPVTIISRDKNPIEILIETQKQGTVECYLDTYGNLVED